MITYVASSLLESPAQVLVNTVNTQGVMGRGIAAEFKHIYPEMFAQYRNLCERGEFDIGLLWLHKTPRKWILNFPTKKHWRNPSKPEYIEAGLTKFVEKYTDSSIYSIAFPALGCGNGGLDWDTTVKPLMEKYLKNLPIDVFIHPHAEDVYAREHENQEEIAKWLRSEPASLPFTEVWEDLQRILSRKAKYKTFANNSRYAAAASSDPKGIRIETDSKRFTVDYDSLLDLWQQLRQYGFTRRGITRRGLDRELSYLAPILAELEYVKPVRLSENDDFDSKPFIGLRYLAPAAGESFDQFSLFPA